MRAYLTAEWGKAVARPYYRIYLAVMAALAAALALIWWWTGREGMFQGSFGECLSLLIPFFSNIMPIDAIISACNAVNPAIDSLAAYILFGAIPFNVAKGIVISIVTVVTYKKLGHVMKFL